jgi:hypothetical protein
MLSCHREALLGAVLGTDGISVYWKQEALNTGWHVVKISGLQVLSANGSCMLGADNGETL